MESKCSKLVRVCVEACKNELGIPDDVANIKVKEFLLAELGQHSNTSPMPDALAQNGIMEEERVEVDDTLQFTWLRPPLVEICRQAADAQTVRIFLNGCFDVMHVGHFNVLRQAKSIFYSKGYKHVVMVAGIHSDRAITHQKGPPLMSHEERIAVLQATKWVDELVIDLPYVSMSTSMADRLKVDFICHGDDLPMVKDGGGMYSDCIENHRFQLLKRTEGISTTQIIDRLLRQTPEHNGGWLMSEPLGSALATTQRLSQFAAPADPWRSRKVLSDARRIVYMDGKFDLLHAGHVGALEAASKLGDYLLVGLHSDNVIHQRSGRKPVLSMLERAMAVLALRIVDDVVLDAPWDISSELLTTMNIGVVVAGKRVRGGNVGFGSATTIDGPRSKHQRTGKHDVARALDIFEQVESKSALDTDGIRQRFLHQRDQMSKRNDKLLQKEICYIDKKHFVPEA